MLVSDLFSPVSNSATSREKQNYVFSECHNSVPAEINRTANKGTRVDASQLGAP